MAAGLKLDPRTSYLFVSAITYGARVYDAGTGALLRAYPCYPNMNGIVATDNGRWLIVNNTLTEQLYRVDPRTGESVRIEITNGVFSTPFTDGLLLHGTTLYSVENFMNRIAQIELSKDLLTGTIAGYIESPNFDVPTTAAFFGSTIYAVNARFRIDGSVPANADDDVVGVGW